MFGFGEFIGQRGGNAVTGREQRYVRQEIGVADNKRNCHGFAQRAPQSQNDAADHTGFGVRQHYIPYDFPGGRTDAVGGFLEHLWRDFKHIAHHRSNKRDDHDGENDSCREQPDANGRTRKKFSYQGQFAQRSLQRRLYVLPENRRKHQQAPHAINDAGDSREQFDGGTQRLTQPRRRQLGEKDCNPE